MSRCYDDGVRLDEEMFPAFNDERNPVLKNKRVSRVRCAWGLYVGAKV